MFIPEKPWVALIASLGQLGIRLSGISIQMPILPRLTFRFDQADRDKRSSYTWACETWNTAPRAPGWQPSDAGRHEYKYETGVEMAGMTTVSAEYYCYSVHVYKPETAINPHL